MIQPSSTLYQSFVMHFSIYFILYDDLNFQGDSGGLITCGGNNELTGVVSFGDNCGIPEFPGTFSVYLSTSSENIESNFSSSFNGKGVYADVSMYKDWIDEIMTSEKLPDYEHSPFPKPQKRKPIENEKDVSDHHDNGADRPKFMTTIAISFAVIISMISNLV